MLISFLPNTNTNRENNDNNRASGLARIFHFKLGREAMRSALDIFGFKKDQIVLMPASLCPAVIEPFSNYGLKIKLYALDRDFQWDIDNLRENVCPNTVAIYVIHYFGITHDLTEVRKLCDEYEIALIEDCALAGYDPSTCIGKLGDVAIFSLWKFHPIGSGAFLLINNRSLPENRINRQNSYWLSSLGGQLKIILKSVSGKYSIPLNLWKKALNSSVQIQDPPPEDNFGRPYPMFKMCSWTKKIFLAEDLEECANQRRENYRALYNVVTEAGIKTLYSEIQLNSIPYCLPIVVDDAAALQKHLLAVGIQTEISVNKPFFNQSYLIDVKDKFPDVEYLSKKVLGIPIHQNLGSKQLRYIERWLVKYADQHYIGGA